MGVWRAPQKLAWAGDTSLGMLPEIQRGSPEAAKNPGSLPEILGDFPAALPKVLGVPARPHLAICPSVKNYFFGLESTL